MVKIGVISSGKYIPENYMEVIRPYFMEIITGGQKYMMVRAFPAQKYIDGFPFDLVFENHEGYEKWLSEGVDGTIKKVEYNWEEMTASITIADTNFPGPHIFQCTTTWTETDCQAAIEAKFNSVN
ncbi:MAG: hypothetical protein ACWA6U_08040 [Breznakibacter sp.]